jgi:hypothetical protein
MEPPAARCARRPVAFFLGRPDEYRQDTPAARDSGRQCGVVGQSQVESEPNQSGGAHAAKYSISMLFDAWRGTRPSRPGLSSGSLWGREDTLPDRIRPIGPWDCRQRARFFSLNILRINRASFIDFSSAMRRIKCREWYKPLSWMISCSWQASVTAI